MNKKTVALWCLIFAILFAGCGSKSSVSKEEYDRIVAERDALLAEKEGTVNNDEGEKTDAIETVEKDNVQNVVDMINSIGTVNQDSKYDLVQIENAFQALSPEEQEKVENYALYEQALIDYDEYMYSTVEKAYQKMRYESYAYRNILGTNLSSYYDYMSDEQKEECLALYEFFMEAPGAVEKKIKDNLKSPSSYKRYSMDVSNIITYDEETGKHCGMIDISYSGTNSFGAEVKQDATVWVYFTINIERKTISISKIQIW